MLHEVQNQQFTRFHQLNTITSNSRTNWYSLPVTSLTKIETEPCEAKRPDAT